MRFQIARQALLLMAVGCSTPRPAAQSRTDSLPLARGGLGCLELHGPDNRLVDNRYLGASPIVRLDSTRVPDTRDSAQGWYFRSLVRLDRDGRWLDASNPPQGSWPTWRLLSDSLFITFSNGRSGAFVVLALQGPMADTLRGHIGISSDVEGSSSAGAAWAIRAPACKVQDGAS